MAFKNLLPLIFVALVASLTATSAPQMLRLGANDQRVQQSCDGRMVQISGNDSNIRLSGHCSGVQVSGNDNVVHINDTDMLQVTGSDNSVTYKRSKSVDDSGSDNHVTRDGGSTDDKQPPSASDSTKRGADHSGAQASSSSDRSASYVATDAASRASAAADRAAAAVAGIGAGSAHGITVDESNDKALNLMMSDQTITRACKAGQVANLDGSHNHVNITGACDALNVSGTGNRVEVQETGSINVNGASNKVVWDRSHKGHEPAVSIMNGPSQVRSKQ